MADNLQFRLGLDTIQSYKRLSYTPWHALAEFVDNSTQSYFNNRTALDAAFKREGRKLEVHVNYDRDNNSIRISDTAMGMDREELDRALMVGARPANDTGRSRYGMGMKTAACWLGNEWTVRTKKLGETVELKVTVEVAKVASGEQSLPTRELHDQDPHKHYTILEVRDLNRPLRGRTLGKIRQFLESMYRQDLHEGFLELTWQGEQLAWELPDEKFMRQKDGTPYRRQFHFTVAGKNVAGWVAILKRGSRAEAGFSILHSGRVVRGYPDSWRPQTIYGQFQGSNDLVNQRIIGEITLDAFQVTHTKDDILWFGEEQEEVEEQLRDEAADYIAVARQPRKGHEAQGPSDVEIKSAVDEIQAELTSNELADLVTLEEVPPPEAVAESVRPLIEGIEGVDPWFSATLSNVVIRGYLEHGSPNDPYVVADSAKRNVVSVIVNIQHPHFKDLKGADGVLNFLRHCVYDALAEWKARQSTAQIDPHTIKMLKDRFLRVAMEIEMHTDAEAA